MTVEFNIQTETFLSRKRGVDNYVRRTTTHWDHTEQIEMCGHPTCGSQRQLKNDFLQTRQ